MPLTTLKSLTLVFNPLDPRTRGIRELLARVSSRKARASNPKCEVVADLRNGERVHPSVNVVYDDGTKVTFDAAAEGAEAIMAKLRRRARDLQVQEVLNASGTSGPLRSPGNVSKESARLFAEEAKAALEAARRAGAKV